MQIDNPWSTLLYVPPYSPSSLGQFAIVNCWREVRREGIDLLLQRNKTSQNSQHQCLFNVPSRVWNSRCNRTCQDRRLEVYVRGRQWIWAVRVQYPEQLPRTWKNEVFRSSELPNCPESRRAGRLKGYIRRLGEEVALSSSSGRSSFGPSCVDSCPELEVHEILYFRSKEKTSSRSASKSADTWVFTNISSMYISSFLPIRSWHILVTRRW
ncbi:hypothetical protein PIB30_002744 [Stylosanthes scabra]|uniref:Uncharacterized protein n=1 Tax=Stylosanthes scabra TaxID=79078 RepID=A0ABU6S2H9_9FABA|nr:hypothetical protein [Stylosanthes scabra]